MNTRKHKNDRRSVRYNRFLLVGIAGFFVLLVLVGGVMGRPIKPTPTTPTIQPTPTMTLPPKLSSDTLPVINVTNADQVASLAWMAHCGTGFGVTWSPDGKTLGLVGSGSAAGNVCL